MQNNINYKKRFIEYVSANVMSMIGLSMYILADTYFISKGLGADGLTALNLALPIYNFIEGTGQMIGIGGASMFIFYHIQNERNKSDEIFTTSITTGLIAGLIFLLIGIFGADKITTALGANEDVYDMTRTYLRMILLFAPAFILNNTMSVFVKNDGEPRLAMTGMLLGSIFNSVFDYIFIFICKMGIFGAVLATICAPIVGLTTLSFHFWRKKHNYSFNLPLYKLHYIPGIISRGVPTLITEMATGIVMIVFNSLILGLTGNVGVAAYGVILNVYLVVIAIFNGIAQGSQPLFSKFYAKNDIKGLNLTFRYALITVAGFSCIVYLFAFGFPDRLTAIFNSEGNTALAALAVHGFRRYFIGVFFLGCNIVMLLYYISIGKNNIALIMSLSRGIFIVMPLAFLLSAFLGMDGIWITAPITEFVVFTAGISYKKTLRDFEARSNKKL
ncbi:MATE family efflux transporter [Lachnospiraceae bacterium C1.1]|nr:MATE family efflux transporter [Lachnospiraceae bacterium C1.1]